MIHPPPTADGQSWQNELAGESLMYSFATVGPLPAVVPPKVRISLNDHTLIDAERRGSLHGHCSGDQDVTTAFAKSLLLPGAASLW